MCAFLLPLVMLQPLEARFYRSQSSSVDPAGAFFGIVGAVTAGIGIYALGSYMEWWGAPTNEELMQKGRGYAADSSKYQPMYREAERALNGSYQEEILYNCALQTLRLTSMQDYLYSLQGLINNLSSIKEKISRRIRDLEKDRSSHYQRNDLSLLRSVLSDVQSSERMLTRLHSFLSEHRSYFKLFEAEDMLAQEYARELELLQVYHINDYNLPRTLRSALSSRYQDAFALIHAMKKLQSDIVLLERALSGAAFKYIGRVDYAGRLLSSLKRVQELIIAEGEYSNLLIRYEAAEREKERLRLERERIAAEQRIAAAKEREASAKETQNWLKAHENGLKAQENRLKEQELYDNRVQSARHRCY